MNKSQQTFRDQLLAAEKGKPTHKYREELANLREQKMSRRQQVAMIAPVLFCVGAAVRMANAALHPASGLSQWVRIGLGIGSVVSLAWAVLLGIYVKNGIIRRGSNPPGLVRTVIMAALAVVGITTFVALGLADHAKAMQVLIVETICLIIAGVLFIQSLIDQAELRTREKLIEVEMQMLEISNRLGVGEAFKH